MTLALLNKERNGILQRMIDAMHNEDSDAYIEAFNDLSDNIEKNVLDQARELTNVNDVQILSSRGVRALTSEETKYYEKLSQAMRSANPKQAINDLDVVMPETVIDSVFDDLRTNHPLLSKIHFENTQGMIKFLVNKNGYQKAVWGALTSEITKELAGGFKEIDMTSLKLSAFIPVSQAMLDLGPVWLDRYIREILLEAIANGMEDGIVNNLISDKGPISMCADLTKGTANGSIVTYAAKEKIAVNDFQPLTVGQLIAKMAKDDNDKIRQIQDVILVVNPVDYFTKVFPATTVMGGDGTYRKDVLPYPMDVIVSVAVPENTAIIGLGYRYFMGVGMGSKDGKVEYSDENQFLEDNRVYKTKLYGNGMPLDNNAFHTLDITNLKPAIVKVETIAQVTDPAA